MYRCRQAGAFTPLMGVVMLVFAMILVGIIHIGRLVSERSDAQRAADSAVLSAALTLRDNPRPNTPWRVPAEILGNRNTIASMSNWSVFDTGTALQISVDVRRSVVGLPPFPPKTVSVTATTEINQLGYWKDDVQWRLPKLALVLDYSGSMTASFRDGINVKDLILKSAVKGLVDAGLRIDFSAVLFSTTLTTPPVPFDPANSATVINQIRTRVNALASGETNVQLAFDTARSLLLREDDTGRFVMFVSDGAPCCAANAKAASRAAAARLWSIGAGIFSVEIQDQVAVSDFTQSMKFFAGKSSGEVGDWYINLASATDLLTVFAGVRPRAVCRTLRVLDPVPSTRDALRVYLSLGGERIPNTPSNEVRILEVPAADDLVDYSDDYYYIYDEVENRIYFSESTCIKIIDEGASAMVRFDPVRLIQ